MGQGLVDFATWCALAEEHGLPAADWPAGLRDPRAAEPSRPSESGWPTGSTSTAGCSGSPTSSWPTRNGPRAEPGWGSGVIQDIPVGVHPLGRRRLVPVGRPWRRGVRVGAPPDPFNQQGQNWSQPPLRPDRLAELGYAPYRDMLRTVLRNAGGVRVDHVIGLFRLWWVPEGQPADQGTYVRYDHEALVGILALEAQRAGAVVIGEDLGTVEPWVRDYLRDRGHLRHVDPVVREGRAGAAARAGALARAVPGDGDHARPAADGGLPCGRAHRAARSARAC